MYVVCPVPPFPTARVPDKTLIDGEVVAEIRPFVAWRKPVSELASVVFPLTFNEPKLAALAKRLVDDAVVEKKFVEVAFVRLTFVPNRFVEVEFVRLEFVAKRLVEVAFVVVALFEIRLPRVVAPRTERVPVAVKLPPRKVLPETSR